MSDELASLKYKYHMRMLRLIKAEDICMAVVEGLHEKDKEYFEYLVHQWRAEVSKLTEEVGLT